MKCVKIKKLIMIANASKGNKFIAKKNNDKMINFCEKLRTCRTREERIVGAV